MAWELGLRLRAKGGPHPRTSEFKPTHSLDPSCDSDFECRQRAGGGAAAVAAIITIKAVISIAL